MCVKELICTTFAELNMGEIASSMALSLSTSILSSKTYISSQFGQNTNSPNEVYIRRKWFDINRRTVYWLIEGILPKGPYLPCVSMTDRALLARYYRNVSIAFSEEGTWLHVNREWQIAITVWNAWSFWCNTKAINCCNNNFKTNYAISISLVFQKKQPILFCLVLFNIY